MSLCSSCFVAGTFSTLISSVMRIFLEAKFNQIWLFHGYGVLSSDDVNFEVFITTLLENIK